MSRKILTVLVMSCVICLTLSLDINRATVPSVRNKPQLTANELASILGIHTWKLNVSIPDNATEIQAVLHTHGKGEPPKDIGGVLSAKISKGSERNLLVVIRPVGGDDISTAEHLQVSVLGFGTGVTVPTAGNPLKGFLAFKDSDVDEVPAAKTTNLSGGFQEYAEKNTSIGDAEQIISLKITVK